MLIVDGMFIRAKTRSMECALGLTGFYEPQFERGWPFLPMYYVRAIVKVKKFRYLSIRGVRHWISFYKNVISDLILIVFVT